MIHSLKNLIWANGRFSWTFMGAVILFTVLFFVTDYFWRTTPMSFMAFATRALIINGILMMLYGFIAFRIGRKG